MVGTLKTVHAEEGTKGLFSGVQPRVMWISIGGFIFFGGYEYGNSDIAVLSLFCRCFGPFRTPFPALCHPTLRTTRRQHVLLSAHADRVLRVLAIRWCARSIIY